MADSKITALTALTAADPVNDMFPVVDVSDTSMAASGTTKKISVNNILSSSPTASGALTVTGLVTAGSAAITGDLTVDTSTLKVDSTNNRVGIGIASPIDVFQISSPNPNVYITDSGVGGSDQANLYLGVNTVPTYAGILVDLTNDILNVRHNQATRLSIGSTGNVSVSTGNVVMATSGKGIDFSATANSSGTMTSELLADYEEGTWTGTLTGTTSAGVGVYGAQTGQYTKIGRTVFVNLYLDWSAHTGTGAISVTGLPFTSSSATSATSAGSIGFFQNISLTAANTPSIYISTSSTTVLFRQMPSGGGTLDAIPMDAAGTMVINISYNV